MHSKENIIYVLCIVVYRFYKWIEQLKNKWNAVFVNTIAESIGNNYLNNKMGVGQ